MSAKRKRTAGEIVLDTLGNIGRCIAALIMVGIITGCIVASVLTVYILRYINSDEQISLEQYSMKYTTILYANDENGAPYELQRLQTMENRIWVDYDRIPRHMVDALVAIEDKRFWDHNGVDWKRTTGAFFNMFLGFYGSNQGGSTITQQLVKNLTGEKEVRVDRKIQEIFRALNLARNYSREQILEAYLNTVYYSNNCYGVQAAANTYFGKDVSELSVAESASIIGITQYPGKWDPFVNPDLNKQRQEHILAEMHEQGYLTDAEYNAAVAEKLEFKKEASYESISPVYSYFVDMVIEDVIADLKKEKGYTYEEAQQMVNSGGLRIFTTIDEKAQDIVTDFYSTVDNFPAIYNENYPRSAFVLLDQNGAIKAIAGDIGVKKGMREFNCATMSRRHPGSSIKPLAAYLQGIENDVITYSTVIDDHPIEYNGQTWPVNYQGNYLGNITVDQAIQQSRNTIPVKIVQMVTPRRCFDFLKEKMNFHSLVESEVTPAGRVSDIDLSPMALGGMVYGVTPLEMAGGYQIYANGGYFTNPYSYTLVTDFEDNPILEKDITPRRVISPETATIVNKLLQRVTTGPYGTGRPAKFSEMPVAGKTGTSSDDFDQWFIGVTPYYIGAVWMGFDTHERIRYGNYPPPLVFKSLMGKLHEGLAVKDFPIWGDVESHSYCAESGELAIAGCPVGGTGWYKKTNLPPECTYHSGMSDSVDLGDRVFGRGDDDDDDGIVDPGESSGGRLFGNKNSSSSGTRRSQSGMKIIDNDD